MPKMQENKRYAIPNVQTNQKAVRIKKAISDESHYYSKFNIQYLLYAINNLSPNAFRIWCLLNKNKERYELKLSSSEFSSLMSKTTYIKSIGELINFGFLREGELFPNFKGYIFVEGGDLEEEEYQEEIKLRKSKDSTKDSGGAAQS